MREDKDIGLNPTATRSRLEMNKSLNSLESAADGRPSTTGSQGRRIYEKQFYVTQNES